MTRTGLNVQSRFIIFYQDSTNLSAPQAEVSELFLSHLIFYLLRTTAYSDWLLPASLAPLQSLWFRHTGKSLTRMQVHHVWGIACAFFLPLDPLFKAPHLTQNQQTGVTLRVLGRIFVCNYLSCPSALSQNGDLLYLRLWWGLVVTQELLTEGVKKPLVAKLKVK